MEGGLVTPEEQSLFQARQKRKNIVTALAIVGFVVLIFVITVFKYLAIT